MDKQPKMGHTPELKLKLTEEQRREIVKFIASTGSPQLEITVQFEADARGETIAPATVLVGAAM